MSNPNEEILSDDEIEARQRAADGETGDPKVDDTPADDADPAKADDVPAAAASDKPTDKPADAPAKPDDKPGATDQPAAAAAAGSEVPGKVDGVLSKDGSRVLPYGALQAARKGERQASAKAERLANELAAAQQLIADMKAGKTPDTGEVTEEDVAEMEANYPEQGKKMRALFEAAKAVPKPAADTKPGPEEGDDPVQDAIDQVPLLLDWQHGDPEKFSRAVEHDAVLVKSPKWAGKPAVERFTEAARRTAEEYDIEFPATQRSSSSAAATAAPQSAAVQAAQRKPPESLSDFKGGSVADHASMDVAKASPQALLGRMQDMTDDEIDAHLAKYG